MSSLYSLCDCIAVRVVVGAPTVHAGSNTVQVSQPILHTCITVFELGLFNTYGYEMCHFPSQASR